MIRCICAFEKNSFSEQNLFKAEDQGWSKPSYNGGFTGQAYLQAGRTYSTTQLVATDADNTDIVTIKPAATCNILLRSGNTPNFEYKKVTIGEIQANTNKMKLFYHAVAENSAKNEVSADFIIVEDAKLVPCATDVSLDAIEANGALTGYATAATGATLSYALESSTDGVSWTTFKTAQATGAFTGCDFNVDHSYRLKVSATGFADVYTDPVKPAAQVIVLTGSETYACSSVSCNGLSLEINASAKDQYGDALKETSKQASVGSDDISVKSENGVTPAASVSSVKWQITAAGVLTITIAGENLSNTTLVGTTPATASGITIKLGDGKKIFIYYTGATAATAVGF